MRSAPSRLQVIALMAAAAVGLHQAHYAVGAGGVTLALSLFVRRVALRSAPSRRISLLRTWLFATAGLLAV